eukprot:5771835-Alexandrium_andersonii.AAC.1
MPPSRKGGAYTCPYGLWARVAHLHRRRNGQISSRAGLCNGKLQRNGAAHVQHLEAPMPKALDLWHGTGVGYEVVPAPR